MPRERVLVWGGGGHGKVVADLVRAAGHSLVGFADRDPAKLGRVVEPGGGMVVIDEAVLISGLETGGALPSGATALALGIGENVARRACAARARGVAIPPLVHPAATVSPSARLGGGTVVFAGAVVNAGASLGTAVVINSGAIVEHDCEIGDGAHVAPGAVLTGGVVVGPGCLIGARAVVLPGLVVGEGAVVGAGAVVSRAVPRGAVVAGVPARIIKGGNA